MDKKNNKRSYKEVHGLLEEAMQDAFTSDEAGPFESPEIDYSFMESKDNKETSKVKDRFNRVAAIIIICLLAVNAVGYFAGTGVSYSEKGLLHRIYEGARGIFTDKDESEYVEIDETGEICIIDDYDKIDEAKKFWPDLYVPYYIPEEFVVDELIVKRDVSGDCWAKYTLIDDDHKIFVYVVEGIDDDIKISSKDKGTMIYYQDKIINSYWDEKNETYVVDAYLNNVAIYIYGNTKEKQLIKLAMNMGN